MLCNPEKYVISALQHFMFYFTYRYFIIQVVLALNLLGVTPALLNPIYSPSETASLIRTVDPKAVITIGQFVPAANQALEKAAEGKATLTDIIVDSLANVKGSFKFSVI